MLSTDDLHGYQHATIRHGCLYKRCALYLGLGLGKTICALSVAAIQIWTGGIRGVLVVAPLRVANTVWAQEVANWVHTCELKVLVCTGTAAQRKRKLLEPADIHVISTDTAPWLVKTFKRSGWRWDMVIIDESSGFKDPSTNRFKQIRQAVTDKIVTRRGVKKLLRSPVERMLLLSATPATNGLQGLWSQMCLLDSGKALGLSFTAFVNQYFEMLPGSNPISKKIIPRQGAKQRIYERVANLCWVLETQDHLEMPDLIVNTIELDMPGAAREVYDKFKRDFLIELPSIQSDELAEVYAPNEGALGAKLLQMCNGAVYTGEPPEHPVANRDYALLHDAKLDALQELSEAAQGSETLLVAYRYKTDLARLLARFPDAQVLDSAGSQIEAWNRREIPMLLANPAGACMGLNLQGGGSTCVFYSLTWSLEQYQQFIGRLYRQGQKFAVTVNHLVMSNSIEQALLRALRSNAKTQQEFIDHLKADLTEYDIAA